MMTTAPPAPETGAPPDPSPLMPPMPPPLPVLSDVPPLPVLTDEPPLPEGVLDDGVGCEQPTTTSGKAKRTPNSVGFETRETLRRRIWDTPFN
jgi:hypothetical protein